MTHFDSLGFAQELIKVDVPDKQANAFASLIRDHVVSNTVRKEDLSRVEERITSEIKQLEQRMTIKLGSMLVVAVGIVVVAQKLW